MTKEIFKPLVILSELVLSEVEWRDLEGIVRLFSQCDTGIGSLGIWFHQNGRLTQTGMTMYFVKENLAISRIVSERLFLDFELY